MREKVSPYQPLDWIIPRECPSLLGTSDKKVHWVVGIFEDSSFQQALWFQTLAREFPSLKKILITQKKIAHYGQRQTLRLCSSKALAGDGTLSIVGLGKASLFSLEKARILGGQLLSHLKSLPWPKGAQVILHLTSFSFEVPSSKTPRSDLFPSWVGVLEGLALGDYEFTKYITQDTSQHKKKDLLQGKQLGLWVPDTETRSFLKKQQARILAIREAVCLTRNWSNEPSNYGTPEFYATEAKKLAERYGLKCRILTEEEAGKEKMEMYLSVGKGSTRPGRIVILEYHPETPHKNQHLLALVGKGVTFDSGGISIKPALKMEDMKHDMTGAASVMGAMALLSLWRAPHRVLGVLAFAENMPSGSATQPGNIVTTRSGKTVEIINTDAEGRLILGDVLDYIQDFKPQAVVDIATLTGAVGVALGKHCAAILGNHRNLVRQLQQAGNLHGERLWELPLFPEYRSDMKSDFADLKNAVNDGYAGTIRAAAFLQEFIRPETCWAHLDIAATAYQMGHVAYYPKKGASGSYTRTLAQWVMDYIPTQKKRKHAVKPSNSERQ